MTMWLGRWTGRVATLVSWDLRNTSERMVERLGDQIMPDDYRRRSALDAGAEPLQAHRDDRRSEFQDGSTMLHDTEEPHQSGCGGHRHLGNDRRVQN